MTDPFESELRELLRRRDPGPPPVALTEQIVAVPSGAGAAGLAGGLRRAAPPLVGLAAGLGLVVLATFVLPIDAGPGDPVAAPPGILDPRNPGGGLAEVGFLDDGHWALVLILAAAALAVAAWWRRRGRPSTPLSTRQLGGSLVVGGWLVVGVVAGIAIGIVETLPRTSTNLGSAATVGHGVGYVARQMVDWDLNCYVGSSCYISGDRSSAPMGLAMYEIGPGEPITFSVEIENAGPVPLIVEGIDRGSNSRWVDADWIRGGIEFTGLALPPPDRPWATDLADLRPFSPITVPPSQTATVVIVGVGGACASGEPIVPVEGSATQLFMVPFVVRSFIWNRSAEVWLNEWIGIPLDALWQRCAFPPHP